ncbi:MAG: hypothetical protein ACLRUO_00365 [Beduini sp.]|uniref:hypothetical protein n=1 Tax=Beduini sp. TaxID=1922300 RepID=UPI003990A2AB
MERKCHCGKIIKSINCYENKKDGFKAYHYFCMHCQSNFTVLVYDNHQVKVFKGFIG